LAIVPHDFKGLGFLTKFMKELIMRNLSTLVFIFAGLASSVAMAAPSKIDISAPLDGAKISAKAPGNLDYVITLGSDSGNHIHIYVDDSQVALLRELKGSYALEPMGQGKHEICIKVVNQGHTPVGVNRCVKVTAE